VYSFLLASITRIFVSFAPAGGKKNNIKAIVKRLMSPKYRILSLISQRERRIVSDP
jgi:hypothetical protein